MLVAAAICPCPPLLVPEVASGAAAELDDLRAACDEALAGLAAAAPGRLYVVGATDPAGAGVHPPGARGSFRPYGADLTVRLGDGPNDPPAPDARTLPPALAVGAWLLRRCGWEGRCEGRGVPAALGTAACLAEGRRLAASADRVGLLVMGDGSARRSEKAPGYLDARAEPFDAAVSAALAAADAPALAALDPLLAEQLMVCGRAPWQVLAGAAEGAGLAGRLLHDRAPYGVGYLVALWS